MENFKKIFSDKNALIVYVTMGDPALGKNPATLLKELEKNGADLIELGIPFSDPLADGPVIQASHNRALKKNITIDKIAGWVRQFRKTSKLPLVIMADYNLIYNYGIPKYTSVCKKLGIIGSIIPNLPIEESKRAHFKNHTLIQLIAPTTDKIRQKEIIKKSKGFIYYISIAGLTGPRKKIRTGLIKEIKALKKQTKLPVAVGFGIANPAQAKEVIKYADGVIIGSALINEIKKGTGWKKYIRRMKNALSRS
ncbi:tryptophan synthase subunit alpha [Candidatus Margulisiibacteriota bacterium]